MKIAFVKCHQQTTLAVNGLFLRNSGDVIRGPFFSDAIEDSGSVATSNTPFVSICIVTPQSQMGLEKSSRLSFRRWVVRALRRDRYSPLTTRVCQLSNSPITVRGHIGSSRNGSAAGVHPPTWPVAPAKMT